MSSGQQRHVILVVDDMLDNIEILGRILSPEYRVRVARNGREALALCVPPALPDLILLDVMMPDLDGNEVCRKLKSDPATRDIPIIFLTALSEVEDEARGLELGAVDFITKPFTPDLVKQRVRNHLALFLAQRELQRSNERLEELVRQRTAEVEAAHRRLQVLDDTRRDFLCAIAHELRTPANGIIGIGELALNAVAESSLQEKLRGYFDQSCTRLLENIDNALRLAQLQTGDSTLRCEPLALETVIAAAHEKCRRAAIRELTVISISGLSGFRVMGDAALLQQSFSTLLQMMIKLGRTDRKVAITARQTGELIELLMTVTGISLKPEACATFFETFSYDRTSSQAEELGLAVPVAGKLIRAMGGEARLEPSEPDGVRLVCGLPLAPSTAAGTGAPASTPPLKGSST